MRQQNLAENKYRPLKKELKKTFTKIKHAVTGEHLPSKNEMLEFMSQVEVMISYPGFGDDHYDSFMRQCTELNGAFRTKNLTKFKVCLALVDKTKQECHGRAKA